MNGTAPVPARRWWIAAVAATCVDLLMFWDWSTRASPALVAVLATVVLLAVGFTARYPVAGGWAVIVASAVTAWSSPYRPTITVLVVVYLLTRYADPRTVRAVVPGAFAVTLFWTVGETRQQPETHPVLTFVVTWSFYLVIVAATWGVARRGRRHHRRVLDLERDRELAAREAVAAERRRVAAELHDIVAHAVTVMVLQAAGARTMVRDRPQVVEALDAVGVAGSQAVAELQRLVTATLDDGASRTDPVALPGLAELDALLATFATTGPAARLIRSGEVVPLDPSVELAAYRVVQEGLTNARRHGGGETTVALTWTADGLDVRVSDTGGAQADPALAGLSSGLGLAGLAERVRLCGGDLRAGPLDGGGFEVAATLPGAAGATIDLREGSASHV